ncbi:hypothetical protein [Oscillatoria salina]|uniref:hypothetical protein n=1 Tax=Oscillatoria salina TaxID=331517 RepID=UPI0013B7CB28|nr:hypothetical protein [Oscillatoria salina]MBZ8182375.1 hypothetical protein [Oscillatoria salina IIICB1]NET90156.1 hypothetical protein [Kamptonema sp. SIO1D9]
MDEYIYDGENESLQKILELSEEKVKIICHKCKNELLILHNWRDSLKYNKRPGIYWPINEKHLCIWFIMSDRREELWRRFYQRQEERKNENY